MLYLSKSIFFVFSLAFLISCNSLDCNEIHTEFESYENALDLIKSTSFKFSDSCDTSASSWIEGAEYFSCDKSNGYSLIKTRSATYTHQDVPIEKWKEFKKANSFGKYYNRNFKGRYQLEL